MLNTPIILIVFKRVKETSRVFEEIRKIKPNKLFIVADGPRNDEEKKLTDETRKILENIDWKCEVYRDYSLTNLGCRKRVVSGINKAFEKVDRAIILEDDCLPDQSFFSFAEEILEKYKDNDNIMHIGGTNYQNDNTDYGRTINNDSYYFSNIAQIWGWATWKRAWNKYDENMSSWPEIKNNKVNKNNFKKIFPNNITWQTWSYIFDRRYNSSMTDWDIAWTYTCLKERGMCIMPRSNLVENIGSGTEATHKGSSLLHTKTIPLSFPLNHPNKILVNKSADIFTYKKVYGIENTLRNKICSNIKEGLPFLSKYIKLLMK